MNLLYNHLKLQLNTNNKDNVINSIKMITCQFQSPQIKGDLQLAQKNLAINLAQFFELEIEEVTKLINQKGDLGDVGYYLFETYNKDYKNQNSNGLYEFIKEINQIYTISGKQSFQRKSEKVQNLFKLCKSPLQLKYLIRMLLKRLRIGVNQKSVINAIQYMAEDREIVNNQLFHEIVKISEENVFGFNLQLENLQNNDQINQKKQTNEQLKQETSSNDEQKNKSQLLQQNYSFGNPIPVMLAKPVGYKNQLQKVLSKFKKPLQCEAKYDGERTQVHYDKQQGVKLFSRRQDVQNNKYLDLVNQIKETFDKLEIQNCIVEGEIVPYDSQNNMLEFQSLLSRKQNYEKLFLFDILMINNQVLMQENFPFRKEKLQNNIIKFLPQGENEKIQEVEHKLISPENPQEIMDYMKEACDRNLEGLILKSQEDNSFYKSNSRTHWIKMKQFLLKEGQVGDTLDLVPIGVYYGKGKRQGVFGAYLMGCYNKNTRQFEAICKLGTGFTDEFMEQQTKLFKEKNCLQEYHKMPYNFNIVKHLKPDYWINNPDQVWEIQCDSFSHSPSYSIGRTQTMPGISLRFPRFKSLRDDKDIESSTDTDQIIDLAHRDNYFKVLDCHVAQF